MKKRLMALLIATATCVVPVNAQTTTVGHFSFDVPDDYIESPKGFFYSQDKGGIMFRELPIYTNGDVKSYLEGLTYPMAKKSHIYTITYGLFPDNIEYARYRGFDDGSDELTDMIMFATPEYGVTVVATDEVPDFDGILATIKLIK